MNVLELLKNGIPSDTDVDAFMVELMKIHPIKFWNDDESVANLVAFADGFTHEQVVKYLIRYVMGSCVANGSLTGWVSYPNNNKKTPNSPPFYYNKDEAIAGLTPEEYDYIDSGLAHKKARAFGELFNITQCVPLIMEATQKHLKWMYEGRYKGIPNELPEYYY